MNETIKSNTLAGKPLKLNWANNLRACATTGVIFLHVATTISQVYPTISAPTFFYSNLLDALMRWCVPAFVMLSGALALPKYNSDLPAFLKKTFSRIALPFLFWSVVYLLYFNWYYLFVQHHSPAEIFSFIAGQFMEGTASHLWYVYMILSMYILFPLLSPFIKFCSGPELQLFLYLWVAFLFISPLIENMDVNFDYTYFTGFIGYILWGYYLANLKKRIPLFLLAIVFVAAFLYTALSTYYQSLALKKLDEHLYSGMMPAVALMAFSVFLLFKQTHFGSTGTVKKVIDWISKYSYGIYLSHLLVLNLFLNAGINFHWIHPLLSVPVITLACLIISGSFTWLTKKVSLLKYVTG